MTTKLTSYLVGQIAALVMRMGRELAVEARTGTPISSCECEMELQRLLQIEVLLSERTAAPAALEKWLLGGKASGFDAEVIYVNVGDQAEVTIVFIYPLRGGEVRAMRKFLLERP